MTDEGKRLTEGEMLQMMQEVQGPNNLHPGSVWEHSKSGNMYTVKGLAFLEANMGVLVQYSRWEPGNELHGWRPSFARPYKEFIERFTLVRI